MRRIVIIDHDNHSLVIEDINEEVLENEYDGDEQRYIDENYWVSDNYTWDWIVDAEYYPESGNKSYNVDFKDLIKK